MKILIVDQFSETGGAQLCIRDLAPEIERRGWQAIFTAPGDGSIGQDLAEFGIRFEPLPGGRYTNGRKTARDIVRYARDTRKSAAHIASLIAGNKIDLVYVNGPRVLPACIAARCPVVFHLHSYLDKIYARHIVATCVRICRAQVIAVSKFAKSAIEGLVDQKRVRVIYSGEQDMGFIPRSFDEGVIRIGMLGRFAPEKGQLDFLRAARLLAARREFPKMELLLFGASLFSTAEYEAQIRQEAADLPIVFAGWSNDVAGALHQLHILAVPSCSIEAAGRVVMEAMSAGTVVVAYRSGGIPEIITHDRTGLLTERPAPESLAQEIAGLVAQPEKAAQIGRDARAEWEQRFQVSRYQNEICNLLEAVVSTQKAIPSNSESIRIADTADSTPHPATIGNQAPAGRSESL